MTREEAIVILKDTPFICPSAVDIDGAIDMAISALEQEPCDDEISRVLERMWNCRGKNTTSIDKVKMEQIIREALPSVQPSRKGHWIDYSDEGFVECPFCEHATNCEDNIDELHYCFYCGAELSADMRGDTE